MKRLGYQNRQTELRRYLVIGFMKSLLFLLFSLLTILSLYDFYWGRKAESVDRRGNDIALILDVSYSMLARDSSPTRLEASKEILLHLLHTAGDSRFSFIPFKGKGIVAVPLTEDRVMLENSISLSGPAWMSSPGSNLEEALRTGLDSLDSAQDRNRIIILATDGEELSGNALKVIREWVPRDIKLIVLGAGTVDPVTVELGQGEWLTDGKGDAVATRLEENFLKDLALSADGYYFPMNQPDTLRNVIDQLEEWGGARQGTRYARQQKYRIFLLPALLLIWLYPLAGRFPWSKEYW